MTFTKDSAIVKSYVFLIKRELRTLDNVPKVFNLYEVVEEIINEL
ncbi:CD1375 family protein [Bavariicoccus seileri]|nr:CD1375 family protein [Bavariicoccus seileri]